MLTVEKKRKDCAEARLHVFFIIGKETEYWRFRYGY